MHAAKDWQHPNGWPRLTKQAKLTSPPVQPPDGRPPDHLPNRRSPPKVGR